MATTETTTTPAVLAGLNDCSGWALLMGDTVTCPDPVDDERGHCGTLRCDERGNLVVDCGEVVLRVNARRVRENLTLVTRFDGSDLGDRAMRLLTAVPLGGR